ncbi:MAG TPA: NADP-dependent isocitrate dehydrogenase, partial [Cryomorphaceae bacterium]|nr:NADP-dependent isocitrate dehydrogenase [Cryomorphaceae bacterium]
FLALTASLEHLAQKASNERAEILSETLDTAISKYLENNKAPSRNVNEIDNRGTHFYLAMYWAEALAEQNRDTDLASQFESIAGELRQGEDRITEELMGAQGKAVDLGGYYLPDEKKIRAAMRPSKTLNEIIDKIHQLSTERM